MTADTTATPAADEEGASREDEKMETETTQQPGENGSGEGTDTTATDGTSSNFPAVSTKMSACVAA